MNKKVRWLSGALCAALIGASLSGCSGKTGGTSGTSSPSSAGTAGTVKTEVEAVIPEGKYDFGGATVVIATPYKTEPEPGSSAEGDRVLAHRAAMEKNWNVHVEFKQIDADNYWSNMATYILSNQKFGDICVGNWAYLADWIGAGAVRDIGAAAQKAGIDFADGTWDLPCYRESTWGSAVYGFLRNTGTMNFGCLYNRKTLAAAGLKDPNRLIAEGGAWTLNTFAEYARAMTTLDADGDTEVYGAAYSCRDVMLWGCIAAAGGSLVDYGADGMPTLALGSAASLEGMAAFNDMLNTDKSIAYIGYENAVSMLPSGEIGLLLCEEWIVEMVRDKALEQGFENDWGLTYFPRGETMDHYMDPTPGTSPCFIPASVSEEEAERALICYAALYAYDDNQSREQAIRARGEELFSDETSVDVYVNIMTGDRVSYMGSRVGLFYSFMQLAVDFEDGLGTPQSLIETYRAEMNGLIQDSPYVKVLQEQQSKT